ncbi:MAG: BofC C-terminal domain-containing protein [Clostridia bacterium]|nr:BofC C-terminal domain-containing protein [Clostridia bacterium]
MNKKIIIWGIIIVLAIIIGFIIYKNINLQQKEIGLNETTQNIVEISELAEQNQDAVTDECLDEWDDYNEYIGKKVEEASNNLTEQDTHYLLKDVYGYIEVYYLGENNNEYLYRKTDISTDYLSQEDKEDLKVGIEVVGIEALNKMLEDFE